MRRITLAFLLLAVAATAAGQTTCTPQLAYNAGTLEWTVGFNGCTNVPTFTVGDTVTFIIGSAECAGTVTIVSAPGILFPGGAVSFKTPEGCSPLATFSATTASLKTSTTTYDLTLINAVNQFAQSFSVGPATAGDEQGNADTTASNSSSQAFNLKYAVSSVYTPPPSAKSFTQRLQRSFSLSIDTTDQDKGFVDDNSVSAAVDLPDFLQNNALFAQTKIGGEVQYERAIHTSDSNLDAVATFDTFIRKIPTYNLFSPTNTVRRGSPLELSLSYGFRRKEVDGAADSDNGTVFTGTALYHLFAADKYQIDFSVTTTWNNVDNLPAGTSKTQHAFKAQVWYAPTASSPFKVTTSFENGSFGPVLTKLRQYFVGIALQNVSTRLTTSTTPSP